MKEIFKPIDKLFVTTGYVKTLLKLAGSCQCEGCESDLMHRIVYLGKTLFHEARVTETGDQILIPKLSLRIVDGHVDLVCLFSCSDGLNKPRFIPFNHKEDQIHLTDNEGRGKICIYGSDIQYLVDHDASAFSFGIANALSYRNREEERLIMSASNRKTSMKKEFAL